jgi:hypothetical protein
MKRSHRRPWAWGRRLRLVTVLIAGALVAAALFGLSPITRVAAMGYLVNETADEGLATPSSPVCLTTSLHCSLRAAIEASNNAGGANTITLPAGIYNLSSALGELQVGPSGGMSVSIAGVGAPATIINAVQPGSCTTSATSSCFRVFDVDPNVNGGVGFSASDVTISGGRTGDIGGAGILNGTGTSTQTADTTTLSNCVVTGNVTYSGSGGPVPGGGLVQTYGSVGITNCVFSNNTSSLVGGAVDMEAPAGGGSPTLEITSSSFTGNTATIGGGVNIANTVTGTISGSTFTSNTSIGNGGGAVGVDSGSMNLTDDSFTGNQSQNTGNGGAVYTGGGTTTIQYSRVYSNMAGSGHTPQVFNNVAGAVTSAENDWWGVNSGPGSGISNFSVSAWQVLTSTASPDPILVNQSSAITASLDATNLGGSIAPGHHLPDGVPVGFANGALGTVSPNSSSLAGGDATTTYTAGGTGGIDSVPTTVDAQTVGGSVTITFPSQITTTRTMCAAFASDQLASLPQVRYTLHGGVIQHVLRDDFRYWSAVTSTGGTQAFDITQSTSEASNPFTAHGTAFNGNCKRLATTVSQSGNTVTITVKGPVAGGPVYIALTFLTSSVIGEPRPTPDTTVMYTISTSGHPSSTSAVNLMKR